ncbi:GlxA family transcriptional regulator [Paraburkholderia sp.]|uniref:GlxA family transcriptional regulator n=1 Tax=Paraburkholderia sp. TaxID=1926495 RepID=UPI003C799F11
METKNVMDAHNGQSPQKPISRARTRADILIFNDFALPEVAVVTEIFHKANALIAYLPDDHPRYEVTLLSSSGGRIASSSSVLVWTESLDRGPRTDDKRLLFVAGGAGARDASNDHRMVDWLCRQHSTNDLVQPIAEGQCLLDAAGLSSTSASCRNGGLPPRETYASLTKMSGAAVTALAIVEQDLGTSIAKLISASLSTHEVPPFSDLAQKSGDRPPSDRINLAVRWMGANITCPISIDSAAEAVAMSERNFLRRFKKEIGMTPSDYLLRARFSLCCRMLLESRLPINEIARSCGFSGGRQLSMLFRRYLSTTPTAYRARKDPA